MVKKLLLNGFPGHTGKKTIQLYHEDFDKVVINHHRTSPEYSQKNNRIRTKGIFRKTEPVRLQFFNSFEHPEKTQVFWMPSFNYNNYDQLLLSLRFFNSIRSFCAKTLRISH